MTKWKRVGDYPAPEGHLVLWRPVMHKDRVYVTDGEYLDEDDILWCELDLPVEIEDPPIDLEIEAAAQVLRQTFWEADGAASTRASWSDSVAKPSWRATAEAARDIFTTKWQPISELNPVPKRPILVRGKVMTVRNSTVVLQRVLMEDWDEFLEIPS